MKKTLSLGLSALVCAATFFPQVARSQKPNWGSGSGWQTVSSNNRTACENRARIGLMKYQNQGILTSVRRIPEIGAEGRVVGEDALMVVFCSPQGDAVFVFDVCPDSVCRKSHIIDLRNLLGDELRW